MDEAAGKFSLLETGILDKPSTRLLFINVSEYIHSLEHILISCRALTTVSCQLKTLCCRASTEPLKKRGTCDMNINVVPWLIFLQILSESLAHGLSSGECLRLSMDGECYGRLSRLLYAKLMFSLNISTFIMSS
jgi:hypothetical protein